MSEHIEPRVLISAEDGDDTVPGHRATEQSLWHVLNVWLGRLVIAGVGLFIGAVVGVIVGLFTGLIEFRC